MPLLRYPGRVQGALYERAARDDGQVAPLPHHLGLAEGDHVVGAGVGTLVVDLAVQVLVFQEHDRIVAADRGAQQAVGVERVGR